MWRRMPTWFPNIRLEMLALSAEQKAQLLETGWLREVAFKTEPRVNKAEIKAFIEAVYGMQVERVSTINYQGKKKTQIDSQGSPHYYRRSDWKKAYVVFAPPPDIQQAWAQSQAELQAQRLQELQDAALEQRRPNFLPAAAAAVAAEAAAPAAAAHAVLIERQQRRADRRRAAFAAAKQAARGAAGQPGSSSSSQGSGSSSSSRNG